MEYMKYIIAFVGILYLALSIFFLYKKDYAQMSIYFGYALANAGLFTIGKN